MGRGNELLALTANFSEGDEVPDQGLVEGDAVFGVAFGAYETIDEYGKHGACLGWFNTKEAAKQEAVGQGAYGGPGSVVEKPTITVSGKTYLLEHPDPIQVDDSAVRNAALIQSALEKLNEEERRALGYA